MVPQSVSLNCRSDLRHFQNLSEGLSQMLMIWCPFQSWRGWNRARWKTDGNVSQWEKVNSWFVWCGAPVSGYSCYCRWQSFVHIIKNHYAKTTKHGHSVCNATIRFFVLKTTCKNKPYPGPGSWWWKVIICETCKKHIFFICCGSLTWEKTHSKDGWLQLWCDRVNALRRLFVAYRPRNFTASK